MTSFWKLAAAGLAGLFALGLNAAYAEHRDIRPAYCAHDHDHRAHASNYYDYYPADRYSRAGPYRRSGLSVSIAIGDHDRYGRYDRYDRYDRGRRHGYRGRGGRILKREKFDTRHRAKIILTEEVVRSRRGRARLVCIVEARGPEAHYVSERRMHRIARNHCSHRAEVRVYA